MVPVAIRMHAHSTRCDEQPFFSIAAPIVDFNCDELPDLDEENGIVKRPLSSLKPKTAEDDERISHF